MYILCRSGFDTDSEASACLLLTSDNDELVDTIRDIQTDRAFKIKPELKQLFQNQILNTSLKDL